MDDNRQEPLDDFELDLEMNDLLDEFGPDEDSEVEIDIFADAAGAEGDNCVDATQCACKKKKVPQHDYAMDSTFISLQQLEGDLTAEQVMFDHTLDNMSIHDENNTVSELLREKGMPPSSSRGRFISDESFLLQGERGSSGLHFLN